MTEKKFLSRGLMLRLLIFAVFFWLLFTGGLMFAVKTSGISGIWPASGLALLAILVLTTRLLHTVIREKEVAVLARRGNEGHPAAHTPHGFRLETGRCRAERGVAAGEPFLAP